MIPYPEKSLIDLFLTDPQVTLSPYTDGQNEGLKLQFRSDHHTLTLHRLTFHQAESIVEQLQREIERLDPNRYGPGNEDAAIVDGHTISPYGA